MTDVKWTIRALEFSNCNCAYGCPCQFNALPTHGNCRAVVGFDIKQGVHGRTKLDGLKAACLFAWPGAVHQGHGEAAMIIDSRADLFGDLYLRNYADITSPDKDALAATLALHHVRWTIFPREAPVVKLLDATPGWRRFYSDKLATVHVREDMHP